MEKRGGRPSPAAEARAAYNQQAATDARTNRSRNLAAAPVHTLSANERGYAAVARQNFPDVVQSANPTVK